MAERHRHKSPKSRTQAVYQGLKGLLLLHKGSAMGLPTRGPVGDEVRMWLIDWEKGLKA